MYLKHLLQNKNKNKNKIINIFNVNCIKYIFFIIINNATNVFCFYETKEIIKLLQ